MSSASATNAAIGPNGLQHQEPATPATASQTATPQTRPAERRQSILPDVASALSSFSRSYRRSVESNFWEHESAIVAPLAGGAARNGLDTLEEEVDVETGSTDDGDEEEFDEESADNLNHMYFGNPWQDQNQNSSRRGSSIAPATFGSSPVSVSRFSRHRTDSNRSTSSHTSGSYYPAGPLSTLGGPPPRRPSLIASSPGAGSPASANFSGSRRRSSVVPKRTNTPPIVSATGLPPMAPAAPSSSNRSVDETTPLLATAAEEEVAIDSSKAYDGLGHDGGHGVVGEDIKSTFAQTCFNAINILMGIGILSLPFAFALTSVAVGVTESIVLALVTNFTARILIRCMSDDVQTYADLGHASFGPRGRISISILFIIELLTASVALVILASDSIQALKPEWDLIYIKIGVGLVMGVTTLGKGTRLLSYGSLVGIVSIIFLITIVLYSGLTTTTPPGSLTHPSPTVQWLIPADRPGGPWFDLPMSVGLVMAGYSGHATFPNIYRDMANPSEYPTMVTVTFTIVTILSTMLGVAGYIMFGAGAMQEVGTNDLKLRIAGDYEEAIVYKD
ncbi:hypothetical protein HDU93_004861 [Gonapodya sp. JEL0774]|nr:hypothetical protein HDU93_004861 [Gonapodya sp. JEL0774]